eukprot:SAG31_NODE_5058_length_2768_cov_1.632072_3_plen_154_part_00
MKMSAQLFSAMAARHVTSSAPSLSARDFTAMLVYLPGGDERELLGGGAAQALALRPARQQPRAPARGPGQWHLPAALPYMGAGAEDAYLPLDAVSMFECALFRTLCAATCSDIRSKLRFLQTSGNAHSQCSATHSISGCSENSGGPARFSPTN